MAMTEDQTTPGEDWVEWSGGECPVRGKKVDIQKEDGQTALNLWAHRLDWQHYSEWGCDGNITAYRVVQP